MAFYRFCSTLLSEADFIEEIKKMIIFFSPKR